MMSTFAPRTAAAALCAILLLLAAFAAQAQVSGTPTATDTPPLFPAFPNPHIPLSGGGGALWAGGTRAFAADPDGSAGDGVQVYRGVAARLQAPPVCTNGTATVVISARVRNDGPVAGAAYSGRLALFNSNDAHIVSDTTFDHPVGSSRVLTITGVVPAADLAAGNVTTAIWLETFHGGSKAWTADQFQASYTYSDCETDLAITKDDGQTAYTPGGTVIYEIVVSNNGPSDVLGAQVGDSLPDGVTDASWTCADDGSGSACGAANGTGAIATTADLPAGSSVTYTLSMTVPIGFGGDLTNTATVAAPVGMTDADPANNTDSDTNTEFTTPPGPDPSVCNISTNGSFESPDIQNDPEGPGDNTAYVNGFAVWRTTTNPISGWETAVGTIDILRHYNNASEGLQSIDLYGTAAATLRQTFTGLVPGAQYTFSVDYSGHSVANSIAVVQLGNGVGAAPVTLATLQPAADSVSNGTAGIPATPAYSVTWSTYRHTFTAAGTEATVQFVNNATPDVTGTGLFIDNFSFAGDPCADLGIVKTVAPEEVRSGEAVVYTVQLTNNGPDPANGAIVTDPGVPDSLECTALTCAADAGATCPAAPTPAQLAAGLAIPTFPVGGAVTLELTCTVTATGL